ncbi:MAG: MbnP family copper-binding protein [Aquabacterium sp.]|uniref:MbnP family copper-binding protein n=1 Tax=Aquabacterium sp. TaxID=1872578 RepID=UPI003BE6C3E7
MQISSLSRVSPSQWALVPLSAVAAVALVACGGGGSSDTRTGVTGTVAVGAQVVGASVTAKCVSGGTTAAVTTDANGDFSLNLVNVTAPCLIEASGGTVNGVPNTQKLHGYLDSAGRANVNPLTELALAKAAGQDPAEVFSGGLSRTVAGTIADGLSGAKTWVNAQVTALGITPPTADIIKGAFVVGDDTDKVLDHLGEATSSSEGKSLSDLVTAAANNSDVSAALGSKTVTLNFAAYNGSSPIDCSSAAFTVGTNAAKTVRVQDFRFYVSNVTLVRADGTEVKLQPAVGTNDAHNYTDATGTNSVSLIDLRQASTGLCASSSVNNPGITATVAAGVYTGVKLTVGVPFALNHLYAADPATPSALQTAVNAGMSWNWRGGRKFTKIELLNETDTKTTLLHLGSTGCVYQDNSAAVSATNPVVSCASPNRLPLSFSNFNASKQVVAVDVGALFAGVDVAAGNTCMSGPTDTQCTSIFGDQLKLTFDATGATTTGLGEVIAGQTQTVFKAITKQVAN